VDQVSKPYLVVIAVVVLFAGMWFTVLRPKEPAAQEPLPTAPGVTGLNRAVGNAKAATDASKKAADVKEAAAAAASSEPIGASSKPNTPTESSTGAPGTARGAAPKAKPHPATKVPAGKGDPSRYVLADLRRGRTAAVLFYDKRGSDDRLVLRELHKVNRHHGKVTVHVARIGRVGEFEAITRGVKVLTSPTILVIGPDRKARTITGFTVRREIDQLISDVAHFG
jgi:hypothetical protein